METQSNLNDMELVQYCLAGRTQAFEAIVEKYQALVQAVLYNATGDWSRSRDLAQETFIAAWKDLRSLREPERLKSWLCGIARNLANNAIRSSSRFIEQPLEQAGSLAQPEAHPLEAILDREEERLVWEALHEIPDTYRETLILYYWEQQSAQQVAERLDLSEDTVKQRLSRGRKLLKSQVESMVEGVLSRVKPGRAFTVAVMAALPAALPTAASAGIALAAAEGSTASKAAAGLALGGAFWGPLLGFAGAAFGVRQSIKSAKSPRERAFVIRNTWYCVAYMIGFYGIMAVMGFLFSDSISRAFKQNFELSLTLAIILVGGSYSVGLIALIYRWNKRQIEIQKEEGIFVDYANILTSDQTVSKSNVYGGIGGSLFGGFCWIFLYALLCSDWFSALIVIASALSLFYWSTDKILREPARYYPVAMVNMVITYVVSMGLVNWKWNEWMKIYRENITTNPLYDRSGDVSLTSINVLLTIIYGCLLVGFYFNCRKTKTSSRNQ